MHLPRLAAIALLVAWCGEGLRAEGKAAEVIGMVRESRIDEISGAAVSQRDRSHLFVVNDSQNGAWLHLIRRDGGSLGKLRVNDAENHDWEDLSAFELDGTPYLLIADTGDNGGLRSTLELLIVVEPELPLAESVDIAWRIPFSLPEGARDIEAVAVDVQASAVYLVAKRHFPRVLYRLPLRPSPSDAALVAEHLGTFDTLPPATADERMRDPKFGRFRGDITSLALDPAGNFALVLSYRELYYYARQPGESWLNALQAQPRPLLLPAMPQAEAVAIDATDGAAIVLSERLLAPIYRLPLR
jgi:hypothetical protein